MKKAIVIGLARSGAAAANLLKRSGWDVVVSDPKSAEELAGPLGQLVPGVELALGGHPEGLVHGADLVVISPGVPVTATPVREAIGMGIEVISEIELAWRHFSKGAGMDFYGVTGTNGKSTTVTLLNMMMRASGKKSLLAGNIGLPLSAALEADTGYEAVVVELSSFQLETIKDFRPRGAAVLNVTPDHMDRYASMQSYRDAKLRVGMNQESDDFMVLNADDPMLEGVAHGDAGLFRFSRLKEVRGVYLDRDRVVYDLSDSQKGVLMKASEIRMKGPHNLENAMAASALALLGGCTQEAVSRILREFGGLEHRLEFVRETAGVRYINDSKGTNVDAVLKSLDSFSSPVVLIAGGRDKDGDFKKLAPLLKSNARAAVLIGEAAGKMMEAVNGSVDCHLATSMQDAVEAARGLAREGDIVLLSPACASFDMFRSFEHRGEEFKKAVASL